MSLDLTPGARSAVMQALALAKQWEHPQVLPVHLALGLLTASDSEVAQQAPEIDMDMVAEYVREHVTDDMFSLSESKSSNFSDAAAQILTGASARGVRSGSRMGVNEGMLLASVLASKDPLIDQVLLLTHIELSVVDPMSGGTISSGSPTKAHPEFAPVGAGAPERESAPVAGKISEFVTVLTDRDDLPVAVGRDRELERLFVVLSRRSKANPVLIGEAGVGKSAVVEELARRIRLGDVPAHLSHLSIWQVDLSLMLAGTKHRGDFEERIKQLLKAARDDSVVLFIDEIHTLMGAGSAQAEGTSASELLKPALARGDMRLIGATTYEEYRKFVEADAALERRLAPVQVDEPDFDTAVHMVSAWKGELERHYSLSFDDQTALRAVSLTDRYLPDRLLPDKAVDALDAAGALVAMKRMRGSDQEVVTVSDIAEVVSEWARVPALEIDELGHQDLMSLTDRLQDRVVGQDHAVDVVARAVLRSRMGVSDPKRPVSFVFAGPTGVGKTELAKTLADLTAGVGNANGLVAVDCSELDSPASVSKLVGSPAGYVGYDDGSSLVERVRRNRSAVVLFDEIEKADPAVFDLLLQVLEEGKLTDSSGRVADFSSTTVIVTSNVGSHRPVVSAGFGDSSDASFAADVLSQLRAFFRPELLNRFDELVVFNPLTTEHAEVIAAHFVSELVDLAAEQGVRVSVADGVVEFLARGGFEQAYGARSLRRFVTSSLADGLADAILAGHIDVVVELSESQLQVTAVREPSLT